MWFKCRNGSLVNLAQADSIIVGQQRVIKGDKETVEHRIQAIKAAGDGTTEVMGTLDVFDNDIAADVFLEGLFYRLNTGAPDCNLCGKSMGGELSDNHLHCAHREQFEADQAAEGRTLDQALAAAAG